MELILARTDFSGQERILADMRTGTEFSKLWMIINFNWFSRIFTDRNGLELIIVGTDFSEQKVICPDSNWM